MNKLISNTKGAREMKPDAYKYSDELRGVLLHEEKLHPSEHHADWEETPLYAIDFTKYKVVKLEPTDEEVREVINILINKDKSGIGNSGKFACDILIACRKAAPKIEDL